MEVSGQQKAAASLPSQSWCGPAGGERKSILLAWIELQSSSLWQVTILT